MRLSPSQHQSTFITRIAEQYHLIFGIESQDLIVTSGRLRMPSCAEWMIAPICLLEFALAELFAQVSHSGVVTLADRYGLLAAILDESLSEEERRSIDRLLRSVCRGKVQIVDEISAVLQPES